jgi:hypothetical protein
LKEVLKGQMKEKISGDLKVGSKDLWLGGKKVFVLAQTKGELWVEEMVDLRGALKEQDLAGKFV